MVRLHLSYPVLTVAAELIAMLKSRRDRLVICSCLLVIIATLGWRYGQGGIRQARQARYAELLKASEAGDTNTIKRLLSQGVPIESREHLEERFPYTQPLIVAARAGKEESVKLLLDSGADPGIDHNGALFEAIQGLHVEMARKLIERGASLDVSGYEHNAQDDSALLTAVQVKLPLLEYKLRPGDVTGSSPELVRHSESEINEIVRLILGKGANINSRDNWGATPLIYAAGSGKAEVVKTLLENHAQIDAQTNNGETPLLAAIKGGHLEAVKALLSHGASLKVNPKAFYDAILLAPKLGHPQLAAYLESASVTAKLREYQSSHR